MKPLFRPPGCGTAGSPQPDRGSALRHLHILGVLSMLMSFASISIDFYRPAMPAMVRSFGVVPGVLAYAISGYLVCFSIGQPLALAARTDWGGLWGLFVPLFLFVSCTGFVVANSIAGALADFPHQAGAVSALVGGLQYGSGIFGSALVGLCADGTPRPMGWVIALCATGSFLCARALRASG